MTVTSTIVRSDAYAGDGVTTAFPVPFQFAGVTDLAVIERDAAGSETPLALGTRYTVTGGDGSTGTVTATAPPPAGVQWVFVRRTPQTQPTDWQDGDRFPAELVEQAADRLTMIVQEASDRAARSLRLPDSDPPRDTTLPAREARAGKALIFDGDGNVTHSTDNYEDQTARTAAAAATASARAAEAAASAATAAAAASEAVPAAAVATARAAEASVAATVAVPAAATAGTRAAEAAASAATAEAAASEAVPAAAVASARAAEASVAAAVAVPAAGIASTRAAEAAQSALTAASLVQVKSPADIAGIPPVIDLLLTSPDGVPSGVVLGGSGKWVTGPDGLLASVPAGVAPIDYDPLTGACMGLLCEEARTNVIKHASDFGNSAWSKVRSTITENAAVAPDGTATADKLVEGTDTGAHSVFQVNPASGTVVHTFSIYAKAGERSSFWLLGQDAAVTANGGRALFTLAGTGVVTSVAAMGSGTGATADIKPWKGGWYRCCLTVTCGSGSELRLKADMLSASGADTYTGDGTSGLYLWGAQVEDGAFATSLILTTTIPITRAADVNTLSLSRVAGWSATEGTLLVEASSSATDAAQRRAVSLRDGGAQNAMGIYRFGSSGQSRATVTVADVSQFNSLTAVWPRGSHRKVALAYRANDFAACLGGGAVVTDQSGSIPAVNTLVIGDYVGGAYAWSGHVRRITHFPVRLSESTLQLLTS